MLDVCFRNSTSFQPLVNIVNKVTDERAAFSMTLRVMNGEEQARWIVLKYSAVLMR